MASFNEKKLKSVLDEYVKPIWEEKIKRWPLRYGGGETYLQEDVFMKAAPFITKNNLLNESKQNLINCLQKQKRKKHLF